MVSARTSTDCCTAIFTFCSECCGLLELSCRKLVISLDLPPFADALVVFYNAEVLKKINIFTSIEDKQKR